MNICENRTALLPICIPASELNCRQSPVWYAATELRNYLGRMTAAVFTIEADAGKAGLALVPADEKFVAENGEDAFTLCSDGSRLTICGGKRGLIYGVYDFLETLGCRFFTPDCEKIPTFQTLALPVLNKCEKPAFEYREHNYFTLRDYPRFAVKCRVNGSSHPIPEHMGSHLRYAWFVHTFEKMLPTAEFGKTHPEYYALVNGERVTTSGGRTQLCLTNPEVLRICIERVRAELLANPDARIISISQNDWEGNCQCENCRRIDAEEGSPSGTLLRFVNAIADALRDEFPDVVFDTLAYMYTRDCPKITRSRPNVCVRLCSIESCFAHPFAVCRDDAHCRVCSDGSKHRFAQDLEDWGKVCDRVYIWDYTTCFAHYPTPHPNWECLQPNLQLMAKNNVKGVFEQACGASRGSTDFNDLRLYLITKLLWNPDCDIEAHRREFMEYYYGAAAKPLDAYLRFLCKVVRDEDIHVGFNDNPEKAFLREELLDRYEKFFDEAAACVSGDALRLFRVEKARLSLRWIRLKRAAMLRGEYDAEEIERFTADWKAFGLTRIDEWCNLETTHRALLDGKWRGVDYFEHWTGEDPEIL